MTCLWPPPNVVHVLPTFVRGMFPSLWSFYRKRLRTNRPYNINTEESRESLEKIEVRRPLLLTFFGPRREAIIAACVAVLQYCASVAPGQMPCGELAVACTYPVRVARVDSFALKCPQYRCFAVVAAAAAVQDILLSYTAVGIFEEWDLSMELFDAKVVSSVRGWDKRVAHNPGPASPRREVPLRG